MSDNQRTRPSEAEVIAKVTEAFVVELRAEWADAGCKTPMQVDGGCDCHDCVLANTVCAALDLVIQHRATPPLAPEVTAEKVALIEALRDAMKVGVPEGSNATEAIRWLTAALSTPPLPSAEPVHEGDGLTWTEFRNHVARVLADAGQHGLRVAFLRRCFTDTTRPPPRRKPRAD